MRVIKRDGSYQTCSFDKVLNRIRKLAEDESLGILSNVDSYVVSIKVIDSIHDGVKTKELDDTAARVAISMTSVHPDYGTLAARISISNLQKETKDTFSETMEILYGNKNQLDEDNPLVNDTIIQIVRKHSEELNGYIDYNRDYLFDYFGFKTLEKSYLLKVYKNEKYNYTKKTVERPQHMWLRVSLGIHGDDLDAVKETYDLMSQFYMIHASPTLFNSGTKLGTLSSCFILSLDDSVEGIGKCMVDCMKISKSAGGIGISMSNIRGKGTYVRGTNGHSDGLIGWVRIFNEISETINQGGRRKASIAIYIEPWHSDIFEFLDIRTNTGDEAQKARNIFSALWVPDIFMRAVDSDDFWYLMSEDTCPGLSDTYGEDFDSLYLGYVKRGKYTKKVKARDIWFKMLKSQIESGLPYVAYKDQVNKKSNQNNYGMVKSNNLCQEVCLVATPSEYGVCNLATLGLPKYIEKDENGQLFYNFEKLYEVTKVLTKNMNKIIDINFYPTQETKYSNLKHRPIGIGGQGLANVFYTLKIPFDSEQAKDLNTKIYETIQYACLEASMELAKINGKYETFEGSLASKGLFQHNLWGMENDKLSGLWDWDSLKEKVIKHGLRNSLVTCSPPTASTSQILGNYESFEPPTNNIFMRETQSGNFPIVNKYLVKDLYDLGLWNQEMKDLIILEDGSIQNIKNIPQNIKELYKTIWEIPQKILVNLSADRALFTDHSQSLNIYMKDPTISKLSSMHMYGWKKGLKTGLYYLRSKAKSRAQKFSIDANLQQKQEEEKLLCSLDNKEACMSCSA
ncbi:MAG TPA: ribonucleoside-diphosphate reductase subunit alpha [Allocoleopsis sp.]